MYRTHMISERMRKAKETKKSSLKLIKCFFKLEIQLKKTNFQFYFRVHRPHKNRPDKHGCVVLVP